MAAQAFIFIETDAGSTEDCFRSLGQMTEVKHLYSVTGPFDLIVLAEAKDFGDLGDVVLTKIRRLKGVLKTTTCIVAKSL